MSETHVYDKAKWHYEGKFPKGLAQSCAFTHGGFLVAWMLRRGFVSELSLADHAADFEGFRQGQLSPGKLHERLGGVVDSDLLNAAGNAFALDYVEESYLEDYEMLFEDNFPKIYDVPDTPEHLEMACEMLDTIYSEWQDEQDA